MRYLQQIWRYFLILWGNGNGRLAHDETNQGPAGEDPTKVTATIPAQTEEPKAPPIRVAPEVRGGDPNAKFMHLEDLLNQIDMCQKLLKVFRTNDPDAYEYHKRVGARLMPQTSGYLVNRLSDEARKTMPGEGMIYAHPLWIDDDALEAPYYAVPMFKYFNKRAFNMWGEGTLYKLNLVWWGPDKKPRPADDALFPTAEECCRASGASLDVLVTPDGRARAVPQFEVVQQRIRHKDHQAKFGDKVSILHQGGLRISPFLKDVLYAHYVERCEARGQKVYEKTAEEFGGTLLYLTINAYMAGYEQDQYTILAEKNGVAARFDVQLGRPKNFFKDRQIGLARDGKRKRIIHWVEPHERVLMDGRATEVKGHFRGATMFGWHGSRVRVLLPKNTFDPRGLPVPAYFKDEDPEDVLPPDDDTIDARGMGQRVRQEWLQRDPKQPKEVVL